MSTSTQPEPHETIQTLRQEKSDVGEDIPKYSKASKARQRRLELYGLDSDRKISCKFSMKYQGRSHQYIRDMELEKLSAGEESQKISNHSTSSSKLPDLSAEMPPLEALPFPRMKSSRTIIVEKYLKLEGASRDKKNSEIYGFSNLDRLRKFLVKGVIKPSSHLATKIPPNQTAVFVDKPSRLGEETDTPRTSSNNKPSPPENIRLPLPGRPFEAENFDAALMHWRYPNPKADFEAPVCNCFHCRRYLGKCIQPNYDRKHVELALRCFCCTRHLTIEVLNHPPYPECTQ